MWNWYWHSMVFFFYFCVCVTSFCFVLPSPFALDWRMGKPTFFYTYTSLFPSVFSMKLKQIKPKAIFPSLWISLTFKLLQPNASLRYVKIKLWIPHIKSLLSTWLWKNWCLISFLLSLTVDTVILVICSLPLIEALYEILYPLMQDFKATV